MQTLSYIFKQFTIAFLLKNVVLLNEWLCVLDIQLKPILVENGIHVYETCSCLHGNNLNIVWYRVVYVECYVVGLIGFSKHTIYNMTTDFGNPRF